MKDMSRAAEPHHHQLIPKLCLNTSVDQWKEGEWNTLPLPSDQYVVKGVTHSGSNGYVAIAYSIQLMEFVAVKRINRNRANQQLGVPLEYKLLHDLQHPNVTKVLDLLVTNEEEEDQSECATPLYYNLVMELGEYGDLHDYLQQNVRSQYNWNVVSFMSCFVKQMTNALSYLHTEKYLSHGDIKVENVLIGNWEHQLLACPCHSKVGMQAEFCTNLRFHLCDFGAAIPIPKYPLAEDFHFIYRGTIPYIAPEIILEHHFECDGKSQDMWAFGCMLYEVLADGSPPYHVSLPLDRERERAYRWASFDPRSQIRRRYQQLRRRPLPPELLEFLSGLLTVRCSRRWKIEDCTDAKWNRCWCY